MLGKHLSAGGKVSRISGRFGLDVRIRYENCLSGLVNEGVKMLYFINFLVVIYHQVAFAQ